MAVSGLTMDSRRVEGFNQVLLKDYGELIIEQGSKEALGIEADRNILAKIRTKVTGERLCIELTGSLFDKVMSIFSTSLNRPEIRYFLTVKDLKKLEITGISNVRAANIRSKHLRLVIKGTGQVDFRELAVDRLDVNISGTCSIEIGGDSIKQNVVINGVGIYEASDLECKTANIKIRGGGRAAVRVSDDLDTEITGVGTVEYSGDPEVRQKSSGIGTVRKV